MSAATSSRARSWVAIAAAYALVLQALFGAVLSGQSLAPTLLDRATHLTLCAPGADAVPLPGEPSTHLPPCCLLGCAWTGTAFAPSERPATTERLRLAVATVVFADVGAAPKPARAWRGARPRGPPLET